MVFTNN